MRNKLILCCMGIICFILQCTLIRRIAIGSVAPNLLVIFVISVGLMRGHRTAMLAGFFTGLLWDLLYGRCLGLYAFLYMTIGFLSGYACKIFYDNNTKVPMLMAAAGDLLYNLGAYCFIFLIESFSFLAKSRVPFGFFAGRIMIPEVIYTVFLAAIVYKIFYWVNHRLMKPERGERDTIWLLK